MMEKKRIVAIVGSNGLPAMYGGYETLVDNLTKQLSSDFDFNVYCSKIHRKKFKEYNGANLIHLPFRANGWQSLIYDVFSLIHATFTSDIILYLGPGAGFFNPFVKLFRKRLIVNHGGLNEWERPKYSYLAKLFSKIGHHSSSIFADVNIADNILLQESLRKTFGCDAIVIRYGGDHSIKQEIDENLIEKYSFLRSDYFVNVSRAQVDNNLHVVLNAFETCPEKTLVMVSNWSITGYGASLKNEYLNKYPNIIILDAVYNPIEINAIRGNAKAYIHSHSYCGTSPSLVEAMSLGLPIISFDVPTNRETTKNQAYYFENSAGLNYILNTLTGVELNSCAKQMKKIADEEYTWQFISRQYAKLFCST